MVGRELAWDASERQGREAPTYKKLTHAALLVIPVSLAGFIIINHLLDYGVAVAIFDFIFVAVMLLGPFLIYLIASFLLWRSIHRATA